MPSLADNSPCVVYECLENAIPFVTTRGSGADELVHPSCWPEVMVEPNVEALAGRLEGVLDRGATLARPRFDPAENLRTWSAWHHGLSRNRSVHAAGPQHEQPTAEATESVSSPTILMITIDAGGVPLSRLPANVTRHIDRFGARAGYLLLTTMREPLQGLVAEILDREASELGTATVVLGPDEIDEARETLLGADLVFVCGAEHEMTAAFFASALRLLAGGQAAVVSCALGERGTESEEPTIREIPGGDVPAVAGLRRPVASGVWAAAVTQLRAELSTIELNHRDYDDLVSAEALGHVAAHRCMLSGKTYLFLPIVGGVRIPPANPAERNRHWYRLAVRTAEDLGIQPIIHGAGAPWFASLAFGSDSESGVDAQLPGIASLPSNHPLREVRPSGTEAKDAERLAAALGRPGSALQISLAEGSAQRLGGSIELSHRATRLRPKIDLRDALGDGRQQPLCPSIPRPAPATSIARLRTALIGRAMSSLATPVGAAIAAMEERQGGGAGGWIGIPREGGPRAYGLNLADQDGESAFGLGPVYVGPTPWKLIFFDIPLAGHHRLRAELQGDPRMTESVEIQLLDQATGAELIRHDAVIPARRQCDIDLDLPTIHGMACIVLQVVGNAVSKLKLVSLYID
jgi:hypothetical protein